MSAPTPAMVEAGAKAVCDTIPAGDDCWEIVNWYAADVAKAVWEAMAKAAKPAHADAAQYPQAAHVLALAEAERTRIEADRARRALEQAQAQQRGEALVRLLEQADGPRWHRCVAEIAAAVAQVAGRLA